MYYYHCNISTPPLVKISEVCFHPCVLVGLSGGQFKYNSLTHKLLKRMHELWCAASVGHKEEMNKFNNLRPWSGSSLWIWIWFFYLLVTSFIEKTTRPICTKFSMLHWYDEQRKWITSAGDRKKTPEFRFQGRADGSEICISTESCFFFQLLLLLLNLLLLL